MTKTVDSPDIKLQELLDFLCMIHDLPQLSLTASLQEGKEEENHNE